MTKPEELARKIAEELDARSKEVTPHHELSIREYADVAQSQIQTALKPLLDACVDLLNNCAVSTEPDVSGLLRRCACCGAFPSKEELHYPDCHFGRLRDVHTEFFG